jgi:predicted transcriptional regulator
MPSKVQRNLQSKDQIKKEFFISLLKGRYEPAINDIVVQRIISKDLFNKYRYELTTDEFNNIGDELEEQGYFQWNDDGRLALTSKGLDHLSQFHKV